jgi:hypothetical protein
MNFHMTVIPPKQTTGLQGPTPVQTLLPASFSLRLLLHKIGIKYKAMVPQYTLASSFSSQSLSRKMIFEPVLQTDRSSSCNTTTLIAIVASQNEIQTIVTACFSTRNGRNRNGFQYHDVIFHSNQITLPKNTYIYIYIYIIVSVQHAAHTNNMQLTQS